MNRAALRLSNVFFSSLANISLPLLDVIRRSIFSHRPFYNLPTTQQIPLDNMGFSHVGINVPADKFEETLNFYLTCLKPLGYREVMRPVPEAVGLGAGFVPEFWVCTKPGASDNQQVHIAFCSNSTRSMHFLTVEMGY